MEIIYIVVFFLNSFMKTYYTALVTNTRVYPNVSGLTLQMVQLSATRRSCIAIL